jgi:deoxyribodipyrimidine photolyase-related protein
MSLIIVFPNQLFDTKYLNQIINYENIPDNIVKTKFNLIILWEHNYFFTKYKYHKMKLLLHRTTMISHYNKLQKNFNVVYIENSNSKLSDQTSLIDKLIAKHKINYIKLFNPIEKELIEQIDSNSLIKTKSNVEYIMFPSIYFLNSNSFDLNNEIDQSLNSTRHDAFYKAQRIRYNILINESKSGKIEPVGSKWSFDRENRSPFEKNETEPDILVFDKSPNRKKLILESINYVNTYFTDHYGTCTYEDFIYPITHLEATKWLDHFVETKLENFGKYEDALSSKIKYGYHSVLSPLTNMGLITVKQILNGVLNSDANIASKEGFIRQLIGWREYCYFIYDIYADNLIKSSIYSKHNKLDIPLKVWEGRTLIPIIDNIIQNLNRTAYSHHIERLMGVGNFLLLIGISPEQMYIWFQTLYIDAYDVFMIPNVYGMLLYGKTSVINNTHMMTRPYFCSSNYLQKMSDYRTSYIEFDNIKCKWSEVFDALYYSFINTYADELKKNYSSASAVSRYNSFSTKKKKGLIDLAKAYIKWLRSDD